MFEVDLTGMVALVTGGATGIGAAVCRSLASANAQIALNYYPNPANPQEKPGDAERVAESIRAAGGVVELFAGDVADTNQDREMIEKVIERFGRLDILINNAMKGRTEKTLDLTTRMFEEMLAVNVIGPFALAQAAIPHMLKQGGGSIVFMSSSAVVNGGGETPAYPACKGALEGMAKNFVKEFAAGGIRTNVVRPSVIVTPTQRERYSDEAWNKYMAAVPTHTPGTPEDVADLITFLSDPVKARYLNGGTFHVDGGRIYQIHPISN